MKKEIKTGLGIFFLVLVAILLLDLGLGYFGVFKTRTVRKEQQNANREVFEQTQSYVEGKRQEAVKYYKEYQNADEETRAGIRNVVALSFANFDLDKLQEPLRTFVYNCMYGENNNSTIRWKSTD